MKDFLNRLRSQIIELWQKTTKVQKGIVIGTGVVIILALSFFIKGATTPDYRPLFTKLDEQSASSVIAKLKEAKIPYQLQDNGTTILVPAKDVDEQRINMVSDGTASDGNVTFSIFDKTQFGETDADKRVKFLRALQGELTRTIEKFPAVETARVHIVTPEPSLFEEKQKDATAAVWLQLEPGKKLSESQINGLVKLVSNSVEGLQPKNVTVVDTNGNVLTGKATQSDENINASNLSETQLAMQQKAQELIRDDVQSMLDKVMGPGQSVVRVQAELDLDQVQKETVKVDGTRVPVSEQRDEKTSETTTNPGGVPGTESNVEGGTTTSYQTTEGGGTSKSEESHRIINNEVGKEKETRVQNPGTIKRLSVAVVFNGEVDQKKQKDIENVVSQAAGIDAKRGDTISVVAMPFNTKYVDEVKDAMAKAEQRQQLMTYGGILAAVALVLIGFIVYRRRKAVQGVVSEEEVFPVDMEPVQEFLDNMPKERELTPEELEKQKIKEQVEKVAHQNPADVAALLKTWLAEE